MRFFQIVHRLGAADFCGLWFEALGWDREKRYLRHSPANHLLTR